MYANFFIHNCVIGIEDLFKCGHVIGTNNLTPTQMDFSAFSPAFDDILINDNYNW